MNCVMDMVDSCMKTQKDFMDSCTKAQKEGLERWAEATVKLQKPFLNVMGAQEGPLKDVLGFYSNGLTTMMNSAKTVADCFKYRNEIGLDVAIEALRECRRERRCSEADL